MSSDRVKHQNRLLEEHGRISKTSLLYDELDDAIEDDVSLTPTIPWHTIAASLAGGIIASGNIMTPSLAVDTYEAVLAELLSRCDGQSDPRS